jgi:hypothetical protein
MQRRAREVLTSIAAAGIGGAIGTLIGRRHPSRRLAKPPEVPAAVPEDLLDDIETMEVIVIEAIPPRASGDDRDDGENWIEDMLERTSNDLPADDPILLYSDDRKR